MNIARYKCTVYRSTVLAVQCDAAEFEKWARRYDEDVELNPSHEACTFSFHERDWRNPVVIWMSPEAGGGSLAHECYHAAREILFHSGIDIGRAGDPSGEVGAYLIGDMFKALCNGLLHGKGEARKQKGRKG